MKKMGKYETRLSGAILFPTAELLDRLNEAANFPHFFAAHFAAANLCSVPPYFFLISGLKLFALNKFSICGFSNNLIKGMGKCCSKLSRGTGEQVHFPHLN
jgi:hypothetical protein